jgi:hypothetical protein
MSTQVKKKLASKGVRLGWTPLKEVKSAKLTPDLVTGERVTSSQTGNQNSSHSANSYLIP